MAVLLAIYILNQSIIRSIAFIKPGVLGFSSEITATKVLYLTNQERAKKGLPELKLNSVLSASAQAKAADMFAKNYWAHNAPDGTNPWFFFKQAGYQYQVAGENLAKDFYDTESMVTAWMKSPTHRDNILHTKYQEIGIAVVNGRLSGMDTTLVVQHFGDPLVAAVNTRNSDSSAISQTVELPSSQIANVWGTGTQTPSSSPRSLISPILLSKIIGGFIFAMMTVVMFIDGLVTLKNKNYRLSSSNTGQIGFLAIIFIMLMFTKQGVIF